MRYSFALTFASRSRVRDSVIEVQTNPVGKKLQPKQHYFLFFVAGQKGIEANVKCQKPRFSGRVRRDECHCIADLFMCSFGSTRGGGNLSKLISSASAINCAARSGSMGLGFCFRCIDRKWPRTSLLINHRKRSFRVGTGGGGHGNRKKIT